MRLLLTLVSLVSLTRLHANQAPLEAWLTRQASIRTLDSSFTQERRLPALKNPITTAGRLSFSKPNQVRWQLGEPAQTLAISDGKILTLIETGTKTARQTAADSPQAARFSLLSGKAFQSLETFNNAFEVVESRSLGSTHQYTVKAKDRRTRAQIPWIFLEIDSVKNELRALEIELQDKSRLRTVFHQPRYNLKLEDSLFQPDLAGYQVK
mgnify:CR=1 FL=1